MPKSALAMLLATSMNSLPAIPADAPTISIAWHKMSQMQIVKMCSKSRNPMSTVSGCYRLEGSVCHVFAPDSDDNADLHVLGHEIKHCFDGNWHGEQSYADYHKKVTKKEEE